ncbi:MAG: LysE family transporter [Alistipes sp.]|nr:LysE family transporter [Alistipes sp.]
MFLTIIDILLRGVTIGLASSITVGPVAVLCIQRTLNKGHKAGFISGLGVACADTLMAIIAFFFYAMLEAQIEKYSYIISLVGGIFVIIIGMIIFFQKPSPQIRRNRAGSSTFWRDFASMFGFTMANFVTVIPYLLAFFAMFGVASHDGSRDIASISSSLFIIIGFLMGAVVWWFLLTLLINLFRRRFRPHHMAMINRIAGIVIGLLGAITILTTVIPNGATN